MIGVRAVSSRERFPSYEDLPDEAPEAGRGATSRWIAGVVILAVAGLLAATVGHKYLARFTNQPKPVPSARDTRAAGFLAEGWDVLMPGVVVIFGDLRACAVEIVERFQSSVDLVITILRKHFVATGANGLQRPGSN